jgi:hypothetical protein
VSTQVVVEIASEQWVYLTMERSQGHGFSLNLTATKELKVKTLVVYTHKTPQGGKGAQGRKVVISAMAQFQGTHTVI